MRLKFGSGKEYNLAKLPLHFLIVTPLLNRRHGHEKKQNGKMAGKKYMKEKRKIVRKSRRERRKKGKVKVLFQF